MGLDLYGRRRKNSATHISKAQRAFVSQPGVAKLPRGLILQLHLTLKGLRNPVGVGFFFPFGTRGSCRNPGLSCGIPLGFFFASTASTVQSTMSDCTLYSERFDRVQSPLQQGTIHFYEAVPYTISYLPALPPKPRFFKK